ATPWPTCIPLRTGLRVAQPGGAWTNGFGYDLAKRLTNVVFEGGSFAYEYDPVRRLQVRKLSLPVTGLYITNTWDSAGRQLSTMLKKGLFSSGIVHHSVAV